MSLFKQALLDVHDELIIDLFAGGGGASSGIEMALGRQVDVAINHDADAVELHKANHPQTDHHTSDVFEIDPRLVAQGRPIGLLWASPDCTYHSKARGGKPIRHANRKRRALAWVVTRWAGQVRPRVIMLENVEEFAQWGPLVGHPDALRPCPRRRGDSFRKWVRSLQDHGYVVEWKELRACDYGAPTIRKRLFLIARCDGKPIVWPEATHGPTRKLPYRTAAECIDWTIPMLSIFATKEEAKAWGVFHKQASPIRPLAENTNRRIARGVKRYVLENPRPFLVTLNHGGTWQRAWDLKEPMRTLCSARDAHAVVSPTIAGVGGRAGQSPERSANAPLGTITSKGDSALVGVGLVPRYGEREGQEPRVRSLDDPAPTVVNTDNGGSLVAASVTKFRTGATGSELSEPLSTVTSNSNETSHPGGATPLGIIAANLATYYGDKTPTGARGGPIDEPLATQPTENRHAVVASFLGQHNGGFAEGNSADGHDLLDPSSTISTKGPHQSVVGVFLDQANGGFDNRVGRSVGDPQATVCAQGSPQTLVGTSMVKLKGTGIDADPQDPLDTINAGGTHHGVVATHIQRDFGQSVGHASDEPMGTVTADRGGHAALVGSFLQKYYGAGGGQTPDEPVHTIPTVDRFGFVTVAIDGQTYVIEDIAMRMLQPRELYNAQGFHKGYIIDRGANGKPLTKTAQVRMCGNSVCPPMACALAKANVPEMIARRELIA